MAYAFKQQSVQLPITKHKSNYKEPRFQLKLTFINLNSQGSPKQYRPIKTSRKGEMVPRGGGSFLGTRPQKTEIEEKNIQYDIKMLC